MPVATDEYPASLYCPALYILSTGYTILWAHHYQSMLYLYFFPE